MSVISAPSLASVNNMQVSLTLRALHSLSLSDVQIIASIKSGFGNAQPSEAAEIVLEVLYHSRSFPFATALCASVLRECLRADPERLSECFLRPELVYDLLNNPSADEEVGSFLWELATVRSRLATFPSGNLKTSSFAGECLKILRELTRRHTLKPEALPHSPLRGWLVKIWKDCPNFVPSNISPIPLLLSWLGNGVSAEEYLQDLLIWLKRLCTSRETEVSVVLSVCRTALTSSHHEFIQMALLVVSLEDLPFVTASLLQDASDLEISSLLHALCLWTPLIPAHYGVHVESPLFTGTPSPLLAFLAVVLRAAVRTVGTRGGNWRGLIEKVLRLAIVKLYDKTTFSDGASLLFYLCAANVPLRTSPSVLTDESLRVNMGRLLVKILPALVQKVGVAFLRKTEVWTLAKDLGIPDSYISENNQLLEEKKQPLSVPDDLSKSPLNRNFGALIAALPPGPLQLAGIEKPSGSLFTDILLSQQTSKEFQWREKLAGIQNFNNTCHLASFLQALFLTSGFVSAIMRYKASERPQNSLIGGLKLLFTRLLVTTHSHIEISDLIRQLPASFRSGEQQDSSETGRFILDQVNEASKEDKSLDVFSGILAHKTKCLSCQALSERREAFHDIVLPVPKASETFGKPVSVQVMLAAFMKPEDLTGDNMYFCESCNLKRDARRWTEIVDNPTHIIFVLNRFSFDPAICDFRKESTIVNTDKWVTINNTNYSLYCGILHEGETVTKGHYVTVGKRSDGLPQSWNILDDSDIISVSDAEARSRISGSYKPSHASYILFFKADKVKTEMPNIEESIFNEATAIEAAAVHL